MKVSLDGKNYDLSWDTVLALRSAGYEVRRATPQSADERRCLGCDEPWQVPGTTVCQTCIVAAQDAALARQDADRG